MSENDKKDGSGNVLPQPSSSDLKGGQSVRATFRLSGKAIEAMSIVSIHLGIQQKTLFDHLLEDAETLKLIAQEIQSAASHRPYRTQKTYVISRKTLSCLDMASRQLNAPRDALVEYSIRRLLPLIARERERHMKRKEIVKELRAYLKEGEKIIKKSRELLGKDDVVHEKFESAMNMLARAYGNIEAFVEKGKSIEDF